MVTSSVAGVAAAAVAIGLFVGLPRLDLPGGDPAGPRPATSPAAGPIETTRGAKVGPAAPCPSDDLRAQHDPNLPREARCAWMVENDFDGDGVTDRFYSYGIPDKGDPSEHRWYLSVVLGSGATTEPLRLEGAYFPRVLGATDANGDGQAEVFTIELGASGSLVGIYQARPDGIRPVSREGSLDDTRRPLATFSLSAAANHRFGLSCEEVQGDATPELVELEATASGGGSFESTETVYEWVDPSSLSQVDSQTAVLTKEAPGLDRYGKLDCFGLTGP